MRVELTRSGGFAGITRRASLGPGDLTPDDVSRIERAIESTPGPMAKGTARGADRFQYDVTIEVDGRSRHLRASETEIPSDVRHLLDELLDRR